MLRGFYTAASGMLNQQRTLDVLTNNVSNAKTPGFRASRVVTTTFDHELLTRMEGYKTGRIGVGSPVAKVDEVLTKFNPNSLEETERPYDMALDGVGYFNIQGQEGPIILTTSDFTVESDGSIYDATGALVEKILVTIPPEGAELKQAVNGMFYTDNMEGNVAVDETTQVVQGWLERNNIDINQEYTMVMEAQRAFQACSTALQIIDEIDRKAATQIAAL